MLEFTDVSRTLTDGREKWEFGPVSARIDADDSVAVVGKSGSGKSTFLHLAGGLLAPDRGQIRFRGHDIANLSSRDISEFRNRHIGFVFQEFFLFEEFTLAENVAMPLFVRGIKRKEALQRAEAVIAQTGLTGKEGNRPSQLSGGQRQRAAIARAIVGEPDILLADEPTGNLDRETGEEIISLLLLLHREHGMALVLVTHDEDLASRAKRKWQMTDGKLKQDSFSRKT